MKSKLTKSQKIVTAWREFTEHGERYRIQAKYRYDDQCGNGHNTFSITANGERYENGGWRDDFGGCCHDKIAEQFPELKKYIKWHLVSSDEPMHYIANTVYHASKVEKYDYFVWLKPVPKLGIDSGCLLALLHHESAVSKIKVHFGEENIKVEVKPNYSMKGRDFNAARNSAVWSEATEAELSVSAEELTETLKVRLPKLMGEFKADMEELGFIF